LPLATRAGPTSNQLHSVLRTPCWCTGAGAGGRCRWSARSVLSPQSDHHLPHEACFASSTQQGLEREHRERSCEAPAQEREHRAVTCEQIRATHPHRLRRYVRALEQRLSARRAPTIVLRLTRPLVEANPLAEFIGDGEAAMRDPPRANWMALNASCSEVKATRHAAGASGYRKSTSRYAYDIHRQMGPLVWALNEYTPSQLSIMARATDSAAKCDTKCVWQMEEPSRRQNDLKSLPARAYLRVSTRFYYQVG
jgi:hypothetical protein